MECVFNEFSQGIGNPKELDFNPKSYVKSKFKPPLAAYFVENEIYKIQDMVAELRKMLPKIPDFNLDKMQCLIVSILRNNPNIILINADKNQGIIAMDQVTYIRGMLKQHCCDQNYYTHLSNMEAFYKIEESASKIKKTLSPSIKMVYQIMSLLTSN